MSAPNKYVPGFRLLSPLTKKRKYLIGSGVAVAFGDALILTSGYIALATTLQAVQVVGIANAENTAGEASSNGLFSVEVIPPLPEYDFFVPLEATAVITAAEVGNLVDLQSEDGLDENDAVTLGLGFRIDEIDVSTAALAASSNLGYVKGHFEYVAAS